VRRESSTQTLPDPAGSGRSGHVKVTVDLRRFGVRVNAPAPPASATVDAAALAG
jgi:hypothetical protein